MKNMVRKVLAHRALVVTAGIFFGYTLVGFLVVPLTIRWYLPKFAQNTLHCQASAEGVRCNPFLLRLAIDGFRLNTVEGSPLVAWDHLLADLEWSSLARLALVVRQVALDGPEIHLTIGPDGILNLAKLVPPSEPTPPQPETKAMFPLLVQEVAIHGGRLSFTDQRQSTPATLSLQRFDMDASDLSTRSKDNQGHYHMALTTDDGANLVLDGALHISSLQATGTLNLNGLRLARAWAFARDTTNLQEPQGQLQVATTFHVDGSATPLKASLTDTHIGFADLLLRLINENQPLLQLKTVAMDIPLFDLVNLTMQCKQLFVADGGVDVRLDEAGRLNWQRLVRDAGAGPAQPTPAKPRTANGGAPTPFAAEPAPATVVKTADTTSPATLPAPAKADPLLTVAKGTKATEPKAADGVPTTVPTAVAPKQPADQAKATTKPTATTAKAKHQTKTAKDTATPAPVATAPSPPAASPVAAQTPASATTARPQEDQSATTAAAPDSVSTQTPAKTPADQSPPANPVQTALATSAQPAAPTPASVVQTDATIPAHPAAPTTPVKTETEAVPVPKVSAQPHVTATTQGGGQKAPSPPPTDHAAPITLHIEALTIQRVAFTLDDRSRHAPLQARIGGIDLSLQANLALGAQNVITLSGLTTQWHDLHVRSEQNPAPEFNLEKFSLTGGSCDTTKQTVGLDRVALTKGRLDAGLDQQGAFNWLMIAAPKQVPPAKNGAVVPVVKSAKTPAAVAKPTVAQEKPPAPPAKPGNGRPWQFLVKTFALEEFSSRFTDLTTPSKDPVISLQGLTTTINGIDGISPMPFTLGFKLEQGGSAAFSGTIDPKTPAVDTDVRLKGLVLTSLQPYLESFVTLNLQSAVVTAQGHFRYGVSKAAAQMSYEGSFGLDDLRLVDSKPPKKPYISWQTLLLPKLKLTLEPNKFEAQEVKLTGASGELIINPDKSINMAQVVKPQPAAPAQGKKADKSAATTATPPPSASAGFPYNIDKIVLDKGNLVFADLSLRPQFMTRIHDLKGTVTGLSSTASSQAQVQVDGLVDQYGQAKINGVLRPNEFTRSSNIEMVFRNLEMKNLSPYSGRFAGRTIKTGKVSADLRYVLKDGKMTGDNKIVIDKLTLGEKVKSEEAADLPLDLAIALLQDGNGRIDIGLPISGDLDDPQFSIGPLVWKVFTNLITKAVTSPFRALGSLLPGNGGEEKFDAIAFDRGRADLSPPEKEKLQTLAGALASRPQLKLVVQGRYSPDADGLALKEGQVRRAVLKEMGRKPSSKEEEAPLNFSTSAVESALEELYGQRFGKPALEQLKKEVAAGTVKPRLPATPASGTKEEGMFQRLWSHLDPHRYIPGLQSPEQKAMWAGELFTRLAEQEPIDEQALPQLAEQRTQVIVAFLQDNNRLAKERLSTKAAEAASDDPPTVRLDLDAL